MAAIDELEDFCMPLAHGGAVLAHLAAQLGEGFELFGNERARISRQGLSLAHAR